MIALKRIKPHRISFPSPQSSLVQKSLCCYFQEMLTFMLKLYWFMVSLKILFQHFDKNIYSTINFMLSFKFKKFLILLLTILYSFNICIVPIQGIDCTGINITNTVKERNYIFKYDKYIRCFSLSEKNTRQSNIKLSCFDFSAGRLHFNGNLLA